MKNNYENKGHASNATSKIRQAKENKIIYITFFWWSTIFYSSFPYASFYYEVMLMNSDSSTGIPALELHFFVFLGAYLFSPCKPVNYIICLLSKICLSRRMELKTFLWKCSISGWILFSGISSLLLKWRIDIISSKRFLDIASAMRLFQIPGAQSFRLLCSLAVPICKIIPTRNRLRVVTIAMISPTIASSWKVQSLQMRIWNPVEHLWWSFLQK